MELATVLAKGPTGEAAKSGPWGLASILILCVVCYFLFKSMSKHMKRVREDFPVRDKDKPAASEARSTGGPTGEPPVADGVDLTKPDAAAKAPTGPGEPAQPPAGQARPDGSTGA